MTELSFLIELLLDHDLKVETKKAIAARIKEVEGALQSVRIPYVQQATIGMAAIPPRHEQGVTQSASTLALLAKHGPLPPVIIPEQGPLPVEQVAQTPAAAAAMLSRSTAVAAQISGKPEKGRTSPRKF